MGNTLSDEGGMTKRITKAAILREARRVYGERLVSIKEEKLFSERPFRYTTAILLHRQYGVYVQASSRAEASHMTLAALQAAGSAR